MNHARWAALAIWLNPALILNGEVLGLGAPLVMLPAVMALLVAHRGAPLAAGIFGGIAAGLSPEGALVLPAIVVAVHSLGPRLGLTRAAAGTALGAGLALSPLAFGGRLGHAADGDARVLFARRSAVELCRQPLVDPELGARCGTGAAGEAARGAASDDRAGGGPQIADDCGRKRSRCSPALLRAAVAAIWRIRACWNTLGTIRLSLHAAPPR